jgi:hypothetical protein
LWARYTDRLALGDDQPYMNAPTFRTAYMTDLINDAIQNYEHFGLAPIQGGWREIDTVQDLDRLRSASSW